MNQREYTIISKQLENINRTLSIVENSNSLINQLMNNTHSENTNRRRSEYRYNRSRNNMNTQIPVSNLFNNRTNSTLSNNDDNNENNTQTYVLRFDTLLPNLSSIINNIREHPDNSYNYTIFNYENNDITLDEIATDYELINIKHFELIENPINDICPITRDRFYHTQNVMMISNCKHIFNKSSLNIWIQNNNTCPSCRSEIRNRSNMESSNTNINNNASVNNYD